MDRSADAGAALFARIRLGDAAADEELVESFSGRVYAMALARTRDREASRDLVQDVLCAVVHALRGGRLHAPDKLAAFISGTARNLINNYCRTRLRTAREIPATPEATTADADEVLDERRRAVVVRSALRELDLIDRRILTMAVVGGLSAVEIATRVTLSPEAVRQRKSRAVRKVMAILAERYRP